MQRREFLRLLGAASALMIGKAVGSEETSETQPLTATAPGKKAGGLFSGKLLIAHRGASAYAPENTLDAYRLAIRQGADLVEQDLNITKDGVLICMHDGSLQGTTNVEEVFPDRYTETVVKGQKTKNWMISDFTLAEIKTLKAGFRKGAGAAAAATEVPTWQEAIDEIRGKAGLCPETKSEGYYKRLGFDMEKMVADVLKRNGLDKPGADSRTPVLMQSFNRDSIRRLQANGINLPMIWLQFAGTKNLESLIPQAKALGYAALGPFKDQITPEFVKAAHDAGVRVITYTYDKKAVKPGYDGITAEMTDHLDHYGIDGLFTNNPDLFPRRSY